VNGATSEAADLRAAKAQRKPMEAIPPTDAAAALKLAGASDVIVAAMGENRYLCGETKDRTDVRLPGEQEKFVQQLIATGKPVILVVFGGRPMVLTNIAEGCRAIVYAWYPGQDGGHAVADLLLGRINPSGKLTITMPRSNEQIPVSYRAGYAPADPPLYPFGYGLSYTTYAYAKLHAPAQAKTTDAGIPIRYQVTNTGAREGVEISQLYLSPVHPAAGQRPIELKGYSPVDLKPNESKTVTITLSPQQLARHNDAGALTIEPGTYQILVGASSTDIRLRATIDLKGDVVKLAHRDEFFSTTAAQ
jgi:beta-glucosidase